MPYVTTGISQSAFRSDTALLLVPDTTLPPTITPTTAAARTSSSTSHISTSIPSTHKEKGAASEKEDSDNDHNDSDSGSESESGSDRSSVHSKVNVKVNTIDDDEDEDGDNSSHNSSTSSSSSESVVAKSQIPSKKARYVTSTTTATAPTTASTTSYISHKNASNSNNDDRHSFDHELDTIDVIQNMRMGKLKKSKVTISTSNIIHTQSQEGHNSDLPKPSRKRTVELVDADIDTSSKPHTNIKNTNANSKPSKRVVITSDEPTVYTETSSSTTQRPSSSPRAAGAITIGNSRGKQWWRRSFYAAW